MRIVRAPGVAPGRSSGSACGPFVWIVASAQDKTSSLAAQTAATFAKVDRVLGELGSGRTFIVSATVYLSNLALKAEFDGLWRDWIGDDPQGWPQRACVGAILSPGTLIEITVVAMRESNTDP